MPHYEIIAPGISIIAYNSFGNYCRYTVHKLLRVTADLLEKCSKVKSPCPVKIIYREGNPKCGDKEGARVIYLSAKGNYYGQWLYQFAHEYLHHLINRTPMTECFDGLAWFEEVLCETASRFVIWMLADEDRSTKEGLSHSYPTIRDYNDNHLPLDSRLSDEFRAMGSIRPWLPLLSRPCYMRNHYYAIANELLPLFCTTPSLWNIIAHIGNSTEWKSLESLFAHLESKMPAEFHAGVGMLKHVLLG